MAAPDPTSLFRFKGVVRWPEEEKLGTTAVLMIKERLLQSRENGVERVVLADEVPCPCHKCLFQPVTVVVSRDHDDFRVPFAA